MIFSLQGFITDNGKALEDLFGDEENTRKADACLNVMANRIATVFASLRVYTLVFEFLFSNGAKIFSDVLIF